MSVGQFLDCSLTRYVLTTVGDTNHRQVGLGYLRMVADCELRIKLVSSIPFCFLLQSHGLSSDFSFSQDGL